MTISDVRAPSGDLAVEHDASDVISSLRLLQARAALQAGEDVAADRLLSRRLRVVQGLSGSPGGAEGDWPMVTREDRMDGARRRAARSHEHASLLQHARARLPDSWQVLDGTAPRRAVLVHRNAWFRGRVAAVLRAGGVDVVAELDDGAAGAGVVLVEQPDLALVEDLLPSYSGLQLLERICAQAPDTAVAIALADAGDLSRFVDAGAAAVFTGRLPPDVLGAGLLRRLPDLAAPRVRS